MAKERKSTEVLAELTSIANASIDEVVSYTAVTPRETLEALYEIRSNLLASIQLLEEETA